MAGSPLVYAELQPQAWKVLITGQGIISLTFVIANCCCAEAVSGEEESSGILSGQNSRPEAGVTKGA